MSSVEDIEDAVAALEPDEFARFRAWFDAVAADRFDQAILKDASEGLLDGLAEQALADVRNGSARPL